jgi:hypothetical protein
MLLRQWKAFMDAHHQAPLGKNPPPEEANKFKGFCEDQLRMGFRRDPADSLDRPVSRPQVVYAVAAAFCKSVLAQNLKTVKQAPKVTVEHVAFICANVSGHF